MPHKGLGRRVSAAAKAGTPRKRGRLFGKTVSAAAKRRGKRRGMGSDNAR